MKEKTVKLKNYLDMLTQDMGWYIIIEDYYGVLRAYDDIRDYLSDKKWHTNPYCLKIKNNARLWKRCVGLKRAMRRNIRKQTTAGFRVCYCGVAEYTIPVCVRGVRIGTVCAAGFFSPLSDRMTEILSKRTDLNEKDFSRLRQENLRQITNAEEERLYSYLSIVAEFIKEIAKDSPLINDKGASENEKQKYVLKALDHIEKHYDENITPQSVAQRYHISLSYLQHLFVEFLGEGIASVIRRKRIERACQLLAQTDRSVRDIAISCGFYDTDYFSVLFKRTMGMTPLKYRKENRVDFY
ncbi:MAG: helix-turn-helix domain-containing protein [Acutalibacteraceae bacterium]|nr:helix-turn-helix domain-containing protein [Acutalibacteraceae bacterium]